jgi:hypothetical protein
VSVSPAAIVWFVVIVVLVAIGGALAAFCGSIRDAIEDM